jgi:hypothetical protein
MELGVAEFVRSFSQSVLPKMQRIGLFRKEDKAEGRGKFYFSSEPSRLRGGEKASFKPSSKRQLATVFFA